MQVRFERDWLRSDVRVYLFEDGNRLRTFYAKGGEIAVTVEEGKQMQDDEILFARIPEQALRSFAEALSEYGIKTDNDHKIAGTLEATKYHLEDMRKISKVKE